MSHHINGKDSTSGVRIDQDTNTTAKSQKSRANQKRGLKRSGDRRKVLMESRGKKGWIEKVVVLTMD